jgi:hypothetical protein
VRVPYSQPESSVIPASPFHSKPRAREAASIARPRRARRRGDSGRAGSGGSVRLGGSNAGRATAGAAPPTPREPFFPQDANAPAMRALVKRQMIKYFPLVRMAKT